MVQRMQLLVAAATILLVLAHVRTGWWIVGLLLSVLLIVAQAGVGMLILIATTNGSTTGPGESLQWVLLVAWVMLLGVRWINPWRRSS